MEEVILVIHLILALAIIGLVLLQRSEGGGLGIGGGGLGGVSTPHGTANLLTRATTICAAGFFCTSLLLGVLASRHHDASKSLIDTLNASPAPADASMMPEAEDAAAPVTTEPAAEPAPAPTAPPSE